MYLPHTVPLPSYAIMTNNKELVVFPVTICNSKLGVSNYTTMKHNVQTLFNKPLNGKTLSQKTKKMNKKKLTKGSSGKYPRGYRKPREKENIRNCIKRNPRYRNMRAKGILTPIVDNFFETTNCLACTTPFKSKCGNWEKKTAIDHHHGLEKTFTVCYRGRLCQRCNTTEGGRSPTSWMRIVHYRTPTTPEVKWATEYIDGDYIRTKLSFK